jgi:hypothetical protein
MTFFAKFFAKTGIFCQSIQIDCHTCKKMRTRYCSCSSSVTGCWYYSTGNCCSAVALISGRVPVGVAEKGPDGVQDFLVEINTAKVICRT